MTMVTQKYYFMFWLDEWTGFWRPASCLMLGAEHAAAEMHDDARSYGEGKQIMLHLEVTHPATDTLFLLWARVKASDLSIEIVDVTPWDAE